MNVGTTPTAIQRLILLTLMGLSTAICRCEADSATVARSLLVPGWGQLTRGQSHKGAWFMSLAAASLGTAGYCMYEGNHAYADYRRAESAAEATRLRDRTVRFDSIRNGALISYGVIWLLNCIDINRHPPAETSFRQSSRAPCRVLPLVFVDGSGTLNAGFRLLCN